MNSSKPFLFCSFLLVFLACRKTDNLPPYDPYKINVDSVLYIKSVDRKEVNEFEITYKATEYQSEPFSNTLLHWSSSPDFIQDRDSMPLENTTFFFKTVRLTNLKTSTRYYGRISTVFRGKRIFSAVKEWNTEELRIENIVYLGYLWTTSWNFNRGDSGISMFTNLPSVFPDYASSTKVYIGSSECDIDYDSGFKIVFHIPLTVPTGKHIVKLIRKGITVFSTDSLEILRGKWSKLTPPVLPLNYPAPLTVTGLFSFGTCQSLQKGYMLGGVFANGSLPWPEGNYMAFINEFDPLSRQWTKRTPINPQYIEKPICYYFNNSIYIIGGIRRAVPFPNQDHMLKKMLKLDLTSLTWTELDSMSHYGDYDMTSFELNNEWYIGMGVDSAVRVNGNPVPSKKFWKYNPSTNQWTRLSDFPGSHQVFPTCFTIGNKAYAFYGAIPIGDPNIAINFLQELWQYDPQQNAWSQIQLPATGGPGPGEKYQIVSYNGKAYFLTAQIRKLGAAFYYFSLETVSLEWDPLSNTYKRIAYSQDGNILKLIHSQGNNFVFHSDALGAYERTPNKTYLFEVEQ